MDKHGSGSPELPAEPEINQELLDYTTRHTRKSAYVPEPGRRFWAGEPTDDPRPWFIEWSQPFTVFENVVREEFAQQIKRSPIRLPDWADDVAESLPVKDGVAYFAGLAIFAAGLRYYKATWEWSIEWWLIGLGILVFTLDWRAKYLRLRGNRRAATYCVGAIAVIVLAFIVPIWSTIKSHGPQTQGAPAQAAQLAPLFIGYGNKQLYKGGKIVGFVRVDATQFQDKADGYKMAAVELHYNDIGDIKDAGDLKKSPLFDINPIPVDIIIPASPSSLIADNFFFLLVPKGVNMASFTTLHEAESLGVVVYFVGSASSGASQ